MNGKPFIWLGLILLLGLYWGFRKTKPPKLDNSGNRPLETGHPSDSASDVLPDENPTTTARDQPALEKAHFINKFETRPGVPVNGPVVRVINQLGQPVEDAIITFPEQSLNRKTGADGLIAMDDVVFPVTVLVSHWDYRPLKRQFMVLSQTVELVLKPFSHFVGRVIDGESREPICEFSLKVDTSFSSDFGGSSFAGKWESVQDKRGRFTVKRLTPGNTLTLWLEADGYGIKRFGPRLVKPSDQGQPRDLLLDRVEELVSGTVVDGKQKPLGGVRVILSGYQLGLEGEESFHWDRLKGVRYPGRFLHLESWTEDNGGFAFDRPGPQFGFDLLFLDGGIARHRLARLGEAEISAYEDMFVSVSRAAEIRVNYNRKRFPYTVHFYLQHQTSREIRFDSLYQPGSPIHFDGLPPGDYTLVLLAFGGDSESRAELSLEEGEKRVVRLGFTETCSLGGSARMGGRPMVEGFIYLVPEPESYAMARLAVTGLDGSFVFNGLEPGPYTLLARRGRLDDFGNSVADKLKRSSNRLSLVLPEEGLDQVFSFAGYCNLQGRILGATISEVALMGDELFLAMTLTSRVAEDGAFLITDVPPGTFDLVTAPNSGARVLVPDLVVVEDGADIFLGDLDLAESGSLRVHVGRRPATGVLTVLIKNEEGRFLAGEAVEDSSAGALLNELPARPIQVALFAFESSWESTAWQNVEIFPGKTSQISLDLEPVTRLMISTDGLAPAIKEVFLLRLENGEQLHILDEGQRLRVEELVGARAGFLDDRLALFKNVAPGRWRVRVIDEKESEHVTEIVLQPGQPRKIGF